MAAGSSVANWALVVGIDRYWSDRAALRGAVRDALTMREWLLDTSGGGVPRENLVLVLGPRDGEQPGVEYVDATKDKIMVAVNDLMTLSGGKGDRFFFYYAGHGLTARVSGRDESALVASDFNAVNTDNSIALRSLWEFFETTQFADQFFFVDACRNIPWNGEREFEIGRWTLPRSRDAGVPPVQQFILYATSPGLKAAEEDDWERARRVHRRAAARPRRQGRRQGVVVEPRLLRGALGPAGRLREERARGPQVGRRRAGHVPGAAGRRQPRRRRP